MTVYSTYYSSHLTKITRACSVILTYAATASDTVEMSLLNYISSCVTVLLDELNHRNKITTHHHHCSYLLTVSYKVIYKCEYWAISTDQLPHVPQRDLCCATEKEVVTHLKDRFTHF